MIDTKLITFLTLLEEKSYTKTASRLYITQPAVTHHIKTLEKEYEITLFTNSKTFDLTKSGQMLLEYAKSQKMQEELLMSSLQKQNSFVCNLGMTSMVKSVIPTYDVFSTFFETMPTFNAYIYSQDEITEKLSRGQLDLGIIDGSFDSQNFEATLITSEKIVLVAKPNGQYKGKDRISKEALSTATLISLNSDSGLARAIDNALKTKNIQLKGTITLETNDAYLMKDLVLMTDGLAFMYYDSVKKDLEEGALKKLDVLNLQISQNIYAIYNKSIVLEENLRQFFDIIGKIGK